MQVDAHREALAALAAAGENPLVRSFPQGAVFAWDHDLRYLSAGGLGLGDVGLSRAMLEGRTIFEVFPPETAAAIEPLYRATFLGESTTVDVPYEGRIYSQHLAPVRDRDGTIVAGMGFTRDVTQVRHAERALRESEERSRLSFEHAPIGQALVELDGRWRRVNAALVQLLGYPEEQLLGMTFQDITHPDDLDADLALVQQLLDGQMGSYQLEKRYVTATGAVVSVLLAVSLVRDSRDAPLYFIAQIQDVTALKRQQQALQDLVAMLAHDLRTPLTTIAGFAELLSLRWDTYSEAQKRDLLDRIRSATTAMGGLLESALTLSVTDADALDTDPARVRVDSVVREVLPVVGDAAQSLDLTGLAPCTAWVDPAHLAHVVTNLLTNAVKYGGDRISLSCEEQPSVVRLRIRDHGGGVSKEFLPRLFDRFSRSDPARAGDQQGAGLGLHIVKSLLDANNASIVYSDTPGGGATFVVTLPRATVVQRAGD